MARRRGARLHPRTRPIPGLPIGFVPARRPGKLPPETMSAAFCARVRVELALELHPDLIPRGTKVVIADDVLATGGTVEAICKLVKQPRRGRW